MRLVILLLVVASLAFGQCGQLAPNPAQNGRMDCIGDPTKRAQKFFGTAAPGSVTGNLPGDFFTDTTAHNSYVCNAPAGTAAPACTAVATAGWLLLNDPTLAYVATNPQTGTTYAILTTDRDKLITLSNANPIAVSIAQAGSTGFPDGWPTTVLNSGVGTATITPATSTIEGAATLVLTTGQSARMWASGANYRAARSGKVASATAADTAAALSATLTEAMEPAHDGDVTNSAGDLTLTIGAAKVAPAMMKASTFDVQTDDSTVTWAIGSVLNAQATLTFTVHSGSRTLNITNPVIGGNYVLKLIQDATGGEGLILGTGCTWKVAGGGAGAVTLTNAANALDVLTFVYDGSSCLASLLVNLN